MTETELVERKLMLAHERMETAGDIAFVSSYTALVVEAICLFENLLFVYATWGAPWGVRYCVMLGPVLMCVAIGMTWRKHRRSRNLYRAMASERWWKDMKFDAQMYDYFHSRNKP